MNVTDTTEAAEAFTLTGEVTGVTAKQLEKLNNALLGSKGKESALQQKRLPLNRAERRSIVGPSMKAYRKAYAAQVAQQRGLKPDAKTLSAAIQTVKAEHLRRLQANVVGDFGE